MNALLLKVDFATGHRAGGLNPKDRNFPCNSAWQDTERGLEIRLVKDGEVGRFRNQLGVTILEGEAAIDAAIADLQAGKPETYAIEHEALLVESIRQRRIDISDLDNTMDANELAKELHRRGCLGVRKAEKPKPPSAAEMHARHVGDVVVAAAMARNRAGVRP